MKREVFDECVDVLKDIDRKIESWADRYGAFHWDDKYYVKIIDEEKDAYDDPPHDTIYCGVAIQEDELTIYDEYEDAEDIRDISFFIPTYEYTRNARGEVIKVEPKDLYYFPVLKGGPNA